MKIKRYTKLVAFRISPEMKQEMEEFSVRFGMSEGKFIRSALGEYLKMRVKGLEEKP